MLLVVVGQDVYKVNYCSGNFLNGQLSRMYGPEPYKKIDRLYDLNSKRMYFNLTTNMDVRLLKSEDTPTVQALNARSKSVTGMELMSILVKLN